MYFDFHRIELVVVVVWISVTLYFSLSCNVCLYISVSHWLSSLVSELVCSWIRNSIAQDM